MNLEKLRHAAVVFKENRDWDGRVDPEAADTLADAVLAMTDPTPVDAAWLDARWPSESRTYRALLDDPHIYVALWEGQRSLLCHAVNIKPHCSRGDVLSLLWGLRVAVPEPKGGEK